MHQIDNVLNILRDLVPGWLMRRRRCFATNSLLAAIASDLTN